MGHTIVFISHKLNEVKELCDSFTILRRGRTVAVGNVNDYTEQELSNMMVGRDVSLEVEKVLLPEKSERPCGSRTCITTASAESNFCKAYPFPFIGAVFWALPVWRAMVKKS